ncbi:carboxypeptidase-like regulatory domain-containing protein [Siccationidurans ginsengisoli]|uniref:carboxypeptidase-like regulatory domain-containing protein n=1 Tax=Hymenobacter TaxID=89966 RepID=UPI001AAD2B14|nr:MULTISPECIES: carboxypeptidase-like regulatory domain-containing protein [unclassified Hymenobacter]MBO2033708.1 carboxypeptidase-like regulatory domain-containing protein [Hymenobacter sp. BT559]
MLVAPFLSRHRLLAFSLLLFGALAATKAHAQAGSPPPTVRVSGRVSAAENKQPIPGATVQIQRTRRGVAADAEGEFLIVALATDTVLFRAVGYKPHRLVLGGTTLSQLVVQVKMVRDSIQLGEVHVTADRPDRAIINRALRNIKRPAPPVVKVPKKAPKPKPLFAVDSTAPRPEPPTISGSNVDWLYDQFSRQGKERRKVEQLKARDAAEAAAKKRAEYNKAFRDNRGYEQ